VSSEFPEKLGSQMLQTVEYEYAFYPHKGDWVEGKVFAEADKLNAKPEPIQISNNLGGDLPTTASHYAIDNDAVVMTTFKKAEDRDSIILRLHNPTNEAQPATISTGLPVKKAWLNNLNEEREEAVKFANGNLSLSIPSGKIITVELQ
jgi:mannosylglycerate hydrolase